MRITRRGGQPIYFADIRVRDVARVEDGLNDYRRITRVNGRDGLSIGVRKQIGANTVAVGDRVKEEIAALQKELPAGMKLEVVFDGTRFVREAIDETEFTLILSGILTAIVCWLFLGSFQSTLNVVLSIPTSVIGSFLILYFLDFTLNLFTLLGLSLAIGIVVDDNIMVLENIVRHFEMGKDRVRAARDGAREIYFAALAASTAVAAIFLPVAFMEGVIGRFFFQFGVTITGAVALSLLDAVTLTPMRAARLLTHNEQPLAIVRMVTALTQAATSLYGYWLERALSWRWITLAIGATVFGLSLLLTVFLRKEFVPPQDQGQFGVRLLAPVGYSLERTSEMVKQLEAEVARMPAVARRLAIIGGFGGGDASTAVMFVTLKPLDEREMRQDEVMNEVRAAAGKIPGLRAALFDFSTRGLTPRRGFPVEFSIRGAEWEELEKIAEQIMARMEQSGAFVDIDSDYRRGAPETRVIPDRNQAAVRGVSIDSIVRTVGAAMGGVRAGRFTNDGRRYDIRLRLRPQEWENPADLARLAVRNNFGELTPLSAVARIESAPAVSSLTRVDRQRAITIRANLPPEASQAAAIEKATAIAREQLPRGYGVYAGGGSRGFDESFQSLYFALWLGVLTAYMVLAAQFNSFLHPIAVCPSASAGRYWLSLSPISR